MLSTKVNIVAAPGSSILEKTKALQDADPSKVNLIAYSSSLLFFPDKVGRWPDYWFWIDPVSAMDGLRRIVSMGKSIDTTILLPSCVGNKDEFYSNKLSTRCDWGEYLYLLKTIRERNLATFVDFECQTQYKLAQEGQSLNSFNNVALDDRFQLPYCLLGAKKDPQDSNLPYNENEKKITMAVLPIMAYFKAKSVGVVGFDGRGGRWHEPTNNRGVDGSYYNYLSMWTKEGWGKFLKWEVFSLLEGKKYVLNKYIPYSSIEDAVRRFQ